MAIYYEHPDWFRPLFKELDARGINYVKLDASCHSYDPAAANTDFSLFFNRMSASAHLRGNSSGIFFTHSYLAHLEAAGVRVINGSRAFQRQSRFRVGNIQGTTTPVGPLVRFIFSEDARRQLLG